MSVLVILLASAASAGVLPVEVSHHTLDNGLRIYLAPMDSGGVVSLQTWVDVGSGDEVTPGTTGHAHFLEHLVFSDTEDWPASERERAIRISGAEENAWTWTDDTVYHQVLPTAALPDLIPIEAARFQRLLLAEDTIRREAGAVQGEWRQSLTDPWEAASNALYEEAFRVHPYHHNTIGTAEDVAAMPEASELVRSFYRTWYRPSRLRIVVAGDFEPEATLAALESVWGSWSEPPEPPPPTPAEPAQLGPRQVQVDWTEGEAHARVLTGWKIPGFHPRDPDAAGLAVLQELLLSEVAPLRRDLVDDRALVYELSGGTWRFRDPHLFALDAELRPDTDPELVQARYEEELERVRAGVDPEELAVVQGRALKHFQLGLDDPHRVAGTLGRFTGPDPDPTAVDAFFEAFAAVTPEDLAALVGTWFVPEGRTEVLLVPTGPDPESLPEAR